jgi:drug/metabolite transporter (DMT)-like permease
VYQIFGAAIDINVPGLLFFSIAGFLISFLSRLAFFSAISFIGVSRVSVFKITSPMFAIVGGVVILGEVLNLKALASTIVVIAGILFISLETMRQNHTNKDLISNMASSIISIPTKGIILGLSSGFLLGIGSIFRKIGVTYIPSSILGACIGSLAGFFSIVIFQVINGKARELIKAAKNMSRDYLMAGIFSSIAMYGMFFALKFIPVSYANSIGASESLFTMFWSLLICGNKEILTIRTLIGAIIVITGITILMAFI